MDFRAEAHNILRENRRVAGGHQYTVPSPRVYPYQWMWDSCFHAIVLAQLEPQAAKAEIRSLLSKQFSSGMLPHVIFWGKFRKNPYDWSWGVEDTSSITQPPMIAYAVWEIHRHAPDAEFLKEVYPAIFRFYEYLVKDRDPQDHHLAGIINPDESGEDNSPRFDAPLGAPADASFLSLLYRRYKLVGANRACNFEAAICMSKSFWVKDIPFNTILVKNLEILGHIASFLGESEGENFAILHAELVKNAMRERLFADGLFFSAMDHDYKPIHVATWAHFVPLFANLYTKEEAKNVIHKHLNNELTFKAPFGIRTVSKFEPSYRPNAFWRGPVWMVPQWFIYKGLMNYGFKEDAKKIALTATRLIEKSGFREYFNPETGQGYGARRFTWGTLILDMMDS